MKKKFRKYFSCPLSPYISWHHGLVYSECPMSPSHRDMGTCERCRLNEKKKHTKYKNKKQRSTPSIEKRQKEPIPNIGKTYTSE